jgi:hypothetical protein
MWSTPGKWDEGAAVDPTVMDSGFAGAAEKKLERFRISRWPDQGCVARLCTIVERPPLGCRFVDILAIAEFARSMMHESA